MCQNGNPAAAEYTPDSLFRTHIFTAETHFVDIIRNRLFFGFGVSVFHHQISDVRFTGIVQCKKMAHFLLRKGEMKFGLEKIKPGFDLFHAKPVPLFHNIKHRLAARVKTVTENMIMPQLIPAGKLDPGKQNRIRRCPDFPDDPICFCSIMVRHREERDPRIPDADKELLGRVCSVGNCGVQMQIHELQFRLIGRQALHGRISHSDLS